MVLSIIGKEGYFDCVFRCIKCVNGVVTLDACSKFSKHYSYCEQVAEANDALTAYSDKKYSRADFQPWNGEY